MELKEETITFFIFILLGIIVGIIFDFFRAIRKVKSCKEKYVYLQDILFFLITGVILSIAVINILAEEIRLYLFVSLFLGIVIYISTISIFVMKIFVKIIKISDEIFKFVFLPLTAYKDIFMTIFDFLSKNCKKYCNKFHNVISYFYKQKIKVRKMR